MPKIGFEREICGLLPHGRRFTIRDPTMFSNFGDLDPLLQVVAIVALIAFLMIIGFKLWRYLQKRRTRSRSKIWTVY